MSTGVIRTTTAVLLLALILLALSCAPASQNTSQNQNGYNASNANVNVALLPIEKDPTCDEVDLEDRRREVEKKINQKIDDDDDLKKMSKGHQGKPVRFKFTVTKVAGSYRNFLEARFNGVITRNDQLDDLVDRLDNFLFEGCVHKVTFGPSSAPPTITTVSPSFEWHYCDYPAVACPDGRCQEQCNGLATTNGGNSNSNSSGNANANSSANANANSTNSNNRP